MSLDTPSAALSRGGGGVHKNSAAVAQKTTRQTVAFLKPSRRRPNTEAKAASVARFKDAALHIFAVFLKHNQQHHRENLPRLRC